MKTFYELQVRGGPSVWSTLFLFTFGDEIVTRTFKRKVIHLYIKLYNIVLVILEFLSGLDFWMFNFLTFRFPAAILRAGPCIADFKVVFSWTSSLRLPICLLKNIVEWNVSGSYTSADDGVWRFFNVETPIFVVHVIFEFRSDLAFWFILSILGFYNF